MYLDQSTKAPESVAFEPFLSEIACGLWPIIGCTMGLKPEGLE